MHRSVSAAGSSPDGVVICGLGMFSGKPTKENCASCKHYEGPSRGLGDFVAKATKAVGVKPCGKCQKRREKLNKLFPNPANKSKEGESG